MKTEQIIKKVKWNLSTKNTKNGGIRVQKNEKSEK